MVAGLAFLSKKAFNPKNMSNQKRVWEAQQEKKLDQQRLREREAQLRREQDDEELAKARDGNSNKYALKFMYEMPSENNNNNNNNKMANNENSAGDGATTNDPLSAYRQPGDDDAAAEFRKMLAVSQAGDDGNQKDTAETQELAFSNNSGAALQGTTIDRAFADQDTRSALEKAVGRKDKDAALTLEEQVARFPQLKNAPMARGMSATNVQVTFKPLGTQLRNVRCMKCGVWGHSAGDRECQVSGWDPFSVKRGPAAQPNTLSRRNDEKSRSSLEIDESKPPQRDEQSDSSSDESSYERRRKKKRKKKRKRHRRMEKKRSRWSEYDSSDGEERRRKKKPKKHRRRYDSDSN